MSKTWKPGVADEPWKVLICARDAERADECLSFLVYVLTNAGSDTESGLAEIREKSAADIIDGLKAFKKSAYDSVAKALRSQGA